MRRLVLAVATVFLCGFLFLTVYAAVDRGFTILSVLSLLILGILGIGVLGALWDDFGDDD